LHIFLKGSFSYIERRLKSHSPYREYKTFKGKKSNFQNLWRRRKGGYKNYLFSKFSPQGV
jgi:shikimate kinase